MDHAEYLTSRERVLKALNFQEPDRIPIDLGGFQTGIHKKAYTALLDYLGRKEEIIMLDAVQQLVKPSEEMLEMFHADIRYITSGSPEDFDGTIRINERNGGLWHDLKDEFGVIWSMPDKQQLFMDISFHPLAEAKWQDVLEYPFPKGNDPGRFTGVRDRAMRLRENTGYAISTGIGGVVYEYCWYLRGLERWFMDMLEDPGFCELLLDKMLEYWLGYCDDR